MMSLQIIVLCCLIAAVFLIVVLAARRQKPLTKACTAHLEYEPSDAYYSDLYEEMMDRANAREAGCTVEELCRCGYAPKAPKIGEGDLCISCFCSEFESIALDVVERAKDLFEVQGVDTKSLLSGEPFSVSCSSFAKFVIAVKYLRKLQNLELITYTLESGTEGVYDVFSWQPDHQEVVVEHHFLLEGCPGGDTDYSCYSYEEWVVANS